jgi:hypothetical protein
LVAGVRERLPVIKQATRKEYLRAKFDEIETNNKMKNIRNLYRGIIDFKEGYQPRTNIVKDDFITDSHSILARWSNHFSQLFNVDEASVVRRQNTHSRIISA